MGPPTASEYAVEPVGVDRIRPSAQNRLSGVSSAMTSNAMSPIAPARAITTSLSAQNLPSGSPSMSTERTRRLSMGKGACFERGDGLVNAL